MEETTIKLLSMISENVNISSSSISIKQLSKLWIGLFPICLFPEEEMVTERSNSGKMEKELPSNLTRVPKSVEL